MDGLQKLLDLIKVPFRYLVGIAVANAIALFAPDSLASKLGLLKYREEGKLYLGLSLLLLVAMIVAGSVGKVTEWYHQHLWMRARKKRLNVLSVDEVKVLRGYIESQTRTQYLGIQSGVARGLEHENIIYRSSSVSAYHMNFAYNIQPWAWDYLNEHRDLLGLN